VGVAVAVAVGSRVGVGDGVGVGGGTGTAVGGTVVGDAVGVSVEVGGVLVAGRSCSGESCSWEAASDCATTLELRPSLMGDPHPAKIGRNAILHRSTVSMWRRRIAERISTVSFSNGDGRCRRPKKRQCKQWRLKGQLAPPGTVAPPTNGVLAQKSDALIEKA
jgi:hypothetical protein